MAGPTGSAWRNPRWGSLVGPDADTLAAIFEDLSLWLQNPTFNNGVTVGDGSAGGVNGSGVKTRPAQVVWTAANIGDGVTTDETVPAVPTGLALTPGIGAIVARWDENADPDVRDGHGSYVVQISVSAVFASILDTHEVGGTSTTFTGLSTGTTYYVRVRARDYSGNVSDFSDPPESAEPIEVGAVDLADLSVTTAKLADLAVTLEKMHADSVDTAQLVDDAVESVKIATSAITETKIADDAITTPKIFAGAVTAGELAAGSVIAGKIAAGTIVAADIAADTITANEIASNAITTNELNALAVTAAKIAANTITAGQIAANTITASQIAANTITAAEIAANAITTSELNADAVTAAKLAALNIAVGKYIRSTTYSAGTAGWTIEADGTAEFNNVVVRGNLAAAQVVGDLTLDTGGVFRTDDSGGRIEMTSTNKNIITFYTGEANEDAPGEIVMVLGDPFQGNMAMRSADFGGGTAELQLNGFLTASGWFLGNDDASINDASMPGSTQGLQINTNGGPVRIHDDAAGKNVGYIGTSIAHGADYFEFRNGQIGSGAGDYGLLHYADGTTLLNASSGKIIELRINNNVIMTVDASIVDVGNDSSDYHLVTHRNNQQGDWTHSGVVVKSHVNESRIAFWADGQGSAPIWKNWFGNFEARNLNDSAFCAITASAFTPSSAEFKNSVVSAEKRLSRSDRKQKVGDLRTVHYQWNEPETHCANCRGAGLKAFSVAVPEEERVGMMVAGLFGKPNGEPCPTCGGDPEWAPAAHKKSQAVGNFGFIVEEVAEQFPEVVGWKQHAEGEEPVAESIELMGMIAILWGEVQDLEGRLAAMEEN